MASLVEKLVRFKKTATIITTPGKPKEDIYSSWYSANELWHFEQEAILDELLAARSKQLLIEMRDELYYLRETWMEQLMSTKPHEDTSDDETIVFDNRTKPGNDPVTNGNTISSIDSKQIKHIVQAHEGCLKETKGRGQPSSHLQQISPRDRLTEAKALLRGDSIKEEERQHSGHSRDPPSRSLKTGTRSPISVSQDVSSALPSSARISLRSMKNDPQKLMPPPIFRCSEQKKQNGEENYKSPIFGPSDQKESDGQENDKCSDYKPMPHPSTRTPKQNRIRSCPPPPPADITSLRTAKGWDSRSRRGNFPQHNRESTPGNNPTRPVSGKSLKQVPPPPPLPTRIIADRRNSDGDVKPKQGYRPNDALELSSSDPIMLMSSTTVTANTASTSKVSQMSVDSRRDHGWSVPKGVHKVICDSLGRSEPLHHPSARTPKQNRIRSCPPPPPVTPVPTTKGRNSRRESDTSPQPKRESTPGNNPTRPVSGKSLKQVPPPPPLLTRLIADRRNSDSYVKPKEGCQTDDAFKRSLSDPIVPTSPIAVTPTTVSMSTVSHRTPNPGKKCARRRWSVDQASKPRCLPRNLS
ncbi:hypothetical protein HJC23_001142 [Cyclotella cryptica]|uniref:Uncharacterized protein n=1 Tax=Cyclotella cryptica TaxID=29204 RepID=A0ABD3P4Y1_9STRA|eukprot:CCRYP_017396-RA/>CCRYP_017396-RA protein AED:0.15 eAED:0.15 QI:0/-1/0/1/-1/1/1/0/581